MKHRSEIAPSVACADLLHLGEEIKRLEAGGIERLHIDVMDGVFVPNYALGTDLVRALHAATDLPLDLHLMVREPVERLDAFALREGDSVSVHFEACTHLQRTLSRIRERGAMPMLALNPATPLSALEEVMQDLDGVVIMTVNPGFSGQRLIPSTLNKIARCRALLNENGYDSVRIECDGNVSFENARAMRQAGADLFVAGTSSLYSKTDSFENNLAKLREAIA